MDWKRKLGSRKFWSLVAVFVTSLLVLFGADSGTTERVTSMIIAGGAVVVYIFSEGNIDAKAIDGKNENTPG